MLKILPQLFYESDHIQKLLVDGLSCVIYKKLTEEVHHKEGYVSTHAITLVLKGRLRVENDKGFVTDVPAGKMIFLPKGLYTISDMMLDENYFEAMVFFFDEQVIAQFVDSLNLKGSSEKCISHQILDHTPDLQVFTQSLLDLYNRGNVKAHRDLTRMKLFEFLCLIAASSQVNCFPAALATLNNKEKRGLRAFMNANYSKPLSIEDYAYLTGRSLSSFRRDFKSKFGVSPKKWLIDKRLEKAYDLLKTHSNATVISVALQVGYENIPHFIKAFQSKYGITPKQFLIQERKKVLI